MNRIKIGVFASILLLTSCDTDSPVVPQNPNPPKPAPAQGTIAGVVWLDENEDGLKSDDEKPIPGATVQMVLLNASENDVQIDPVRTDENGEYQISWDAGTDFLLRFQTPPEYSEHVFTRKDAGDEEVDSDVDPNGETDTFTLEPGIFPILSAGILPKSEPVVNYLEIIDGRDDCEPPGGGEKHSCTGDITQCSVRLDPSSGVIEFSCEFTDVPDYNLFDFYVGFNLDGDTTTGRTEGQSVGIDKELYLYPPDERIQINNYDVNGTYLRGDILDVNATIPILGTEEGRIGIRVDWIVDELIEVLKANPVVNFRLVTYEENGEQFFDDTPALPEIIDWSEMG